MSVSINHPKDGVAEIIIDRDDKRNALNSETVKGITDAAIQLAKDDDLRVVVLRATGTRAFSAGADISELSGLDKATAFNFINNLRGAIQAIFDLPVPVICRIQGACIGGCDGNGRCLRSSHCYKQCNVLHARSSCRHSFCHSSRTVATPYGSRTCRMVGLIW